MIKSYTPDLWVIVKFTSPEFGNVYKVLASWYGGYLGTDTWKLSSGNLQIIDLELLYRIPQESGSEYLCYKGREGISNYSSQILMGWEEKFSKLEGTSVSIVNIADTNLDIQTN